MRSSLVPEACARLVRGVAWVCASVAEARACVRGVWRGDDALLHRMNI